MKSLNQEKLTRVLITSCVALAVIVGLEAIFPFEAPDRDRADAAPQRVLPEKTSLPSFTARPLREFDQVLGRPLFFEDRRLPVRPLEQAPETQQLEPLRLTLEGVAIGGGARVAVLHDERERTQIRLAEGMTHNGWVLEKVRSAGAEFRRGTDVARLELDISEDPRRRRR